MLRHSKMIKMQPSPGYKEDVEMKWEFEEATLKVTLRKCNKKKKKGGDEKRGW